MSQPKTRDQKVQALLSSVRSEGDGYYSVESEALLGWRYLCCPTTSDGPATCTCEDQRRKRVLNPTYICKHILAVKAHRKAQRPSPPDPRLLSMAAHLERLAERQARETIPQGLAFIEA